MKKRATKAKKRYKSFRQTGIDGSEVFVAAKHCKACIEEADFRDPKGKRKTPYKKPHHKLCSRNRKTRGRDERIVAAEAFFAANVAANNAPIDHDLVKLSPVKAAAIKKSFFLSLVIRPVFAALSTREWTS